MRKLWEGIELCFVGAAGTALGVLIGVAARVLIS